ncbi:MAG: hypothetical protein AB8B53_00675 [Flavobacteriales bacterium]
MKNTLYTILAICIAIVLSSCQANRFISSNFDSEISSHETIAVLPVEMIFTGNIPKDLTPEAVASIEEYESLEFQTSVYSSIIRSTKRGKKPLVVSLQSKQETNSRLAEAGISVRESWIMNPTDLAKVLGVNAVVSTKITKERFLSDASSYGIDLGVRILADATGTAGLPVANRLNRTYQIDVDVSAVSANTGNVLFSNRDLISIDWQSTPEQAIERVNRRLIRKFPYSKKK